MMADSVKKKPGRPKGKPCSEREIAQRKAAAPAAARARSPEGQRASSKNRWVHGRYAKGQLASIAGKPCQTTCPKYPCVFVNESKTKPGQSCLDAVDLGRLEHVAEAILQAVQGGDTQALNEVATLQLAGNIEILNQLRSEISSRGVIIEKALFSSSGKQVGADLIENPALKILVKLCSTMGFSLSEFLATPQSLAKSTAEDEQQQSAAEFTRAISRLIPDSMQVPAFDESEITDAEIIPDSEGDS